MKETKTVARTPASWDETFMDMAKVVSNRSKDPSTQVGACIVSKTNRILSLGYNGTPNGWSDDSFPWGKDGDELETKYVYVIHAERNAILNFEGNTKSFQDATIYITHSPCSECAKEIVQVGIKKVVYEKPWRGDSVSFKAAERIFKECGVEIERFTKTGITSVESYLDYTERRGI